MQGEVGWTIVQGYSLKKVSSTWTINQENQQTRKLVPVWLLRALMYHLKLMPYRAFLPKRKKKVLEMGFSQYEAKKAAEDKVSRIREKMIYARKVIDE